MRSLTTLWALFTHFLVGIIAYQSGFHVGISSNTQTAPEISLSYKELKKTRRMAASESCNCPKMSPAIKFESAQSTVDALEFLKTYDAGLPPQPLSSAKPNKALILHIDGKSVPTDKNATKNCHYTRVVYYNRHKQPNQCIAVVPYLYNVPQIHHWARMLPDEDLFADRLWNGRSHRSDAIRKSLPPRLVGQHHLPQGSYLPAAPKPRDLEQYNRIIGMYHTNIEQHMKELAPIAKAAAKSNKYSNMVSVATVNSGQVDLLANWVCHNRAHKLPTKHLLVFATDTEAAKIARDLGLHVYETDFGLTIPKQAAEAYGDPTFQALMLAKVYAVHLTLLLGNDVLFQDVDIVWYRNVLEEMERNFSEHDIVFQDDGARSPRFGPYYPNSGLYLMRYNERTVAFMNDLARQGDAVLGLRSHQAVVARLMTQHVSLHGLRPKVIAREDPKTLPCGYHFHRDWNYMRAMLKTKKAKPLLFHMSWTNDKTDKRRFMEQMGQWYLLDGYQCSAEALFRCHFRDKPSIEPCHSSPRMDKGSRRDFW